MPKPTLYPLTFEPVLKDYIWGGRNLETLFGRALPPGVDIAESWEISAHPHGDVTVANGPLRGRSLAWLTRGHRRVPYRGIAKNDAWLHLRTAAVNLRRLLNLGLTGTDGRWALAS